MASSIHFEDVTSLDQRGGIIRNFDRPPKKDTVTVPDGGYTVVRFHANNPGMWLLHCHVEFHVEIGMAVLMQVGDVTQFPPLPQGFPTCGDWGPPEARDSHTENESPRDSGTIAEPSWSYQVLFVIAVHLWTPGML
ncbi:laccase-4 [Plakobranchus ocellatus]|uniref:Laccase-4 n=1 Tax=Plakobranchus ocellatus TaxID=259542 RepID=A0AAV4AHH1_9GAST|nr:laccase-4 [Plakobranchus ocellatus]